MSSSSEPAPISSSMVPDAAVPSSSSSNNVSNSPKSHEDDLRQQLRSALQSLSRREPIEPTYRHLLMNGVVTARKPILPKNKLYNKSIGAELRERVTRYMEQPTSAWDRIAQRGPLDETAMRAALTLREGKKHEQEGLLAATLAARRRGDDAQRKRRLEEIAMGLQKKKRKSKETGASSQPESNKADDVHAAAEERRRAEMERERLRQQRAREAARRRQGEAERRRREEEELRARMMETPQLALRRVYQPIFQMLWDMEFDYLGGTNPFRIVIDRENCAAMGAPDYFDIIQKPMNLTYIQEKVQRASYPTLSAFFDDVNLLLRNALKYNSDPNNDYHTAAKEMKRKFTKAAKRVVTELKSSSDGAAAKPKT